MVCVRLDVMIVWLFVRVCACGLNMCLCVMECVMLYGLLLCVRVCVWLIVRVSVLCALLRDVVCVAAVSVCVCV